MKDITQFFCQRLATLNFAISTRPRVLVVDDDPNFTLLIKELLPEANVDIAATPEQAVDMIRKAVPFARVVIDLNLKSKQDGIDVIEQLKAYLPNIPVTILTAYVDEEGVLASHARRHGFTFISKQEKIDTIKAGIQP